MDLVTQEIQKAYLKKHAKIALARLSFYDYCRIIDPDGYVNDDRYLEEYCDILNNFYYGNLLKPDGKPYKKLMINLPPQHKKTRTMIHFCTWVLGRNRQERIITASYNDRIAFDFSKYSRDEIEMDKIDPSVTVYRDIFPNSRLKRGSSALDKWALEGEHFNYLGAGIGGSITSKGATLQIVDDPIKGAFEAMNENLLEKIWLWYTGTFMSRVSAQFGEPLEIILMTRWAKKDLCGRILDSDDADNWYQFLREVYDKEKDEMLSPTTLNKGRYDHIKKTIPAHIFQANYHQKTMDLVGSLYKNFKTYDELPKDVKGNLLFSEIKAYVDTADTGEDWLCAIAYGVYLGYAYVLDIYFTDAAMEETEPKTADMLYHNGVKHCKIESNNGGRGFARNVKTKLWQKFESRTPVIKWFHQSKNKRARILTNATSVEELLLFPKGWESMYPDFHGAMISYQKLEIKDQHDDAPDCCTGIIEDITKFQGNIEAVPNIL